MQITAILEGLSDLLAWGIGGIGAFLAIFGIVNLGIGISGDNPSDKQKGVLGIVGGIILIGVGVAIPGLIALIPSPP